MQLDKAVSNVRALYPELKHFRNTIDETEIDANPSLFFIWESKEYHRGENKRGLYNNIYLTYMTREEKDIDIPAVIDAFSKQTGLTFMESNDERGKIEGTDRDAYAVHMRFSYMERLCYA